MGFNHPVQTAVHAIMNSTSSNSKLAGLYEATYNYATADETPILLKLVPSLLLALAYILFVARPRDASIPIVGSPSWFYPRLLANLRFFRGGLSIMDEGYAKYPNKIWSFARADFDMYVMPQKYIDELRNISSLIASPTQAHVLNLMGRYTMMDIIMRRNLHFRTMQEKVTPNLNLLTGGIAEELDYAVEKDLGGVGDEWTEINPHHMLVKLIARISARVFLGLPICRDEEWLELSTDFTKHVFGSVMILRLFPDWLHRPISWILPSTYKCSKSVARAKQLLNPEIIARQALHKKGELSYSDPAHHNLLSWMLDMTGPEDSDPGTIAHLQVAMALASIHTSKMALVHTLYDLVSKPEYLPPIRHEIATSIAQHGQPSTWTKAIYAKLILLDSFMKESQRMNPPMMLAYYRLLLKPHTFTDGTTLPQGTRLSVPVQAILNDTLNTPNPSQFDGFRYARERAVPGEENKHQFGATEPTHLHFGYGRYACPGRAFASVEVKNILVKLVGEYDVRFPEGMGRPENLMAYEFISPDPEARLMIKLRGEEERKGDGAWVGEWEGISVDVEGEA